MPPPDYQPSDARDVVVFGAGQIAEVIAYYLTHEAGRRVAAFTVDGAYLKEDSLMGVPVVAFEEVAQAFAPDAYGLYVAVSYKKSNAPRAAKLAEAEAKGYRAIAHVSPRAVAAEGFVARPNTFVMEHNTIQPFASIGRNTIVWSGNHIGHHSRIGDNGFISSHVVVAGNVAVGDNAFLGVNATLRDNITLGSHVVVGAGALVMTDAPDFAVFPGQGTEIARVRSDRLRW